MENNNKLLMRLWQIKVKTKTEFIHYMADLLGWRETKWVTFALFFLIKFFSRKIVLLLPSVFYLLHKLNFCLHSPPHHFFWGEEIFEKMRPGGEWVISLCLGVMIRTWGKMLTGRHEYKMSKVNFVTRNCISQ